MFATLVVGLKECSGPEQGQQTALTQCIDYGKREKTIKNWLPVASLANAAFCRSMKYPKVGPQNAETTTQNEAKGFIICYC